jgi:hypothetical protein
LRSRRKIAALVALAAGLVATLATAPSAFGWTVDITAQPKLKRTHHWTIAKSVDTPTLTLKQGETATVKYSVTVTNTGSTDSDWAVAGTVTFSSDPDITIGGIESFITPGDIAGNIACIPSPFPVTLVSGLACDYEAALPNADPREAHAKATVTASPDGPGFRHVSTPFDFSSATIEHVDECVNVTDSMAGNLGTVCVGDSPKTFTYEQTIGPFSTCGDHTVTNTATFVTTDTGATGSAGASVGVTVTCIPLGSCHETVNPAGNPAVGDNGHPDDPFGGDAVPGGTSTSPGTRGNGPINSDGFYLVGGLLFSDTTPIPYPGGGFVWPSNTTVKYTEWGNSQIRITSRIGGPNSVIEWHVQAPGDMYANAPMGAAGAIFCGVPPPPF